MKNHSTKKPTGFTIIEVLTVTIVIGILSGISITSYISIQRDTRNSQRSNQIKLISEALEKYYEQNGEYPNCSQMTASAAIITSTTLTNIQPKVLSVPSSAEGTNSFQDYCNTALSDADTVDAFAYLPLNQSSTACQDSEACTSYTLQYREEGTNAIRPLSSRHSPI